jgi:hypothetical protein
MRMGLTWRDGVSGLVLLAVIVAYAAYLGGAHLFLVSSTWAASATILVLGFGCAACATSDLYTRPQPRWGVAMRKITFGIGLLALLYGLAGIVANSTYGLRNMVALIIVCWGTACIWHTLSIGGSQ